MISPTTVVLVILLSFVYCISQSNSDICSSFSCGLLGKISTYQDLNFKEINFKLVSPQKLVQRAGYFAEEVYVQLRCSVASRKLVFTALLLQDETQ